MHIINYIKTQINPLNQCPDNQAIDSPTPLPLVENKNGNHNMLHGALYHSNGYSLPQDLMEPAFKISQFLLKQAKQGARKVFESIGYLCLTTDKRLCYKKQKTLGADCGRFGDKTLSRRQIIRIEKELVDLGLYHRSQFNRRQSYDRALTPLGTVVYLILKKLVKYSSFENMSHRKGKNVTSQFLRQKGNKREEVFLNLKEGIGNSSNKIEPHDKDFVDKFEKKNDMVIADIGSVYAFDIQLRGVDHKNNKVAQSALSEMRKMLTC